MTKKNISYVLPASFFFVIIWLYFFGLFDSLSLGVPTLAALILVSFIAFGVTSSNFISKNALKASLSPAFIFFILSSFFTFLISKQMHFGEWDEFSHWGPAVKSLYLFDKLGPDSPAQLVFPEYPPGLSLFSYFVAETGLIWNEGYVFWSYQLIVLSIATALISKLQWKNKIFLIFSSTAAILATVMFFNSFQTIYADPILSLIFGYSLIIATSKGSQGNLLLVLLSTSALTLIKDTGLIFAAITALIFSINNFYEQPKSGRNNKYKAVGNFFVLVTSIIFMKLIWSWFLNSQNVEQGRNITNVISSIFSGNPSAIYANYFTDVTSAFIDKFFNQPITRINALPLSSFKWVIILAILMVLFAIATKDGSKKKSELINAILIATGAFAYGAILLVLYLTVFTEGEARGLASYDRYFLTYLGAIVVLITWKFIDFFTPFEFQDSQIYISKDFNKYPIFLWIIVLILQSSPSNLISYVYSPASAGRQIQEKYKTEFALIEKMNLSVEDRVWIISQHTVGFEFYMFQYQLLPASVGRSPWSIGSYYGPGDIWTDSSITPAIWEAKLKDFDYVFVYSVTDSFKNEFGRLFEKNETFDKPAFYAVGKEFDKIKLVRVQ